MIAPRLVCWCLLLCAASPNLLHTHRIALGVVCGAVTSGLGYALWYAGLPKLAQATAACGANCRLPVIAIIAGRFESWANRSGKGCCSATALVLGGIALAVSARSAPTVANVIRIRFKCDLWRGLSGLNPKGAASDHAWTHRRSRHDPFRHPATRGSHTSRAITLQRK